MASVHATAIVDPAAELAGSVIVGPYAVIGAGVTVGEGTSIGAHCVIEGPTTIGRDNRIFSHAALGGAPQDMKYRGEPTQLVIGDRNTIREFCTLNRGTAQDTGVTRVGDDNWIMAYVHIVGDWVIVGGLSGVHQFCKIGAHAMTGFQSHVSQDVPPFMMVSGHPLAEHGFNVEGLRRRGFSRERIALVNRCIACCTAAT